MHNLIPHIIQDNFSQGVYRGGFSTASLFLDISGFTAMTEALMQHGPHGAEVLAAIMREVLEAPIRLVYGHGGFINSIAGDAFTALFPQGEGQSIGCRQALAATWQIQQHLQQKNLYESPYGAFRITAKAGLACGPVSWGILRAQESRRAAYYFEGAAIDGCAEAEHRAQAGQIILQPEFSNRLQDQLTVEDLGQFHHLTGIHGQLPAPQEVDRPQPDLAIQSQFFPEALLTQQTTGEFRQVVNLFINLPTVHTEAQLEIFMQTVFALQDQYGGLLNRLDFGDKGSNLLLFWGAPVAYENDIERALNFILALQTRTSLPIHAGVTYRMAHAGFTGSALREEYTCHGRGVNLAARFMTNASRGEIWVDEQVAERAQAGYEIEYQGEMAFKGFTDAQRVYVLYEQREKAETIYRGQLVGRQAELEQLERFVDPLWQGKFAGVLVLVGEPGIGKSRLVHAFQASPLFARNQALWVQCQTDEILREPLNPFRYWLQRYFGQSQLLVESRNKRSFNHKLDSLIELTQEREARLAEELDRTRSFLGALIGLRWSDSLYEQLDPPGRYENTLIALTVLLQAESLQQPVILFLEDAQWLDEDSKRFLAHLERLLRSVDNRSYPLALIATSRREQSEFPWNQGVVRREINLGGIPKGDLTLLAEAQLGGPISPELAGLLAERAEGNPFFAEQILHYLQEEELLEQDQNGWRSTAAFGESPLPRDVHALLVARLDRLAQQVRQVVQTAAILGREFELQLLRLMLRNDPDLARKVTSAEKAEVWVALSELRYLFKHGLLLDAAYRMQVRSQRRALHALAAESLENLYREDLAPHYSELAYHCEQAGLIPEARRYLQLAGSVAQEAYQNSQAIDYYSRALRLTPEGEGEARYALLLRREQVYEVLGDRAAQRADLETLQQLAAVLRPGAADPEVAVLWADYALKIGDHLQAAATAESAASFAMASARPQTAVKAHLIWSSALWRQGSYTEAIQQAEQGLRLARQSGDAQGQGRALNLLGLLSMEKNDFLAGRSFFEQGLLLARQIGDLHLQAMLLSNLGNLTGWLGDFSSAREHYQGALQLEQEIGHRNGEGTTLVNLGWVFGVMGDYATARSFCEQALRIARETGDRQLEAVTRINLSSYARLQGDLNTALAYAEQGLSGAQMIGDRSSEAWALLYCGHTHFELRQFDPAKQAYLAGQEIRQALNQPNLGTELLAGLARVALASGDQELARAHVQSILTYLEQGGTLDGTDEPLRVYLTCYQVLQDQHDPRSKGYLSTAYQLLQEQTARIEDEVMRQSYLEQIPHHREIAIAWTAQSQTDLDRSGEETKGQG